MTFFTNSLPTQVLLVRPGSNALAEGILPLTPYLPSPHSLLNVSQISSNARSPSNQLLSPTFCGPLDPQRRFWLLAPPNTPLPFAGEPPEFFSPPSSQSFFPGEIQAPQLFIYGSHPLPRIANPLCTSVIRGTHSTYFRVLSFYIQVSQPTFPPPPPPSLSIQPSTFFLPNLLESFRAFFPSLLFPCAPPSCDEKPETKGP